MADYINREAAVAFAEHAYHEWNLAMAAADGQRQINRCFKMQELCKAVASVFVDAPTADVEPVRHGRWVKTRDYLGNETGFYSCTVCKLAAIHRFDYCPNCGAKMDLEGENDY